jgi:transcriptional regulator with XRE-family HTH domain
MTLALDVGVSARHMSFVETGRSRPSRPLLLRIADRLDIPGREENTLLEAAGHARRYRETDLSDPDLGQVTRVLRFLLDRHEPNSALIINRHWDVVMSNGAHRASRDFFLADPNVTDSVRQNLLRLTFHPDALRRQIVNFSVVGPTLMARLERELAEAPGDGRLEELVAEIRSYGPLLPAPTEEVPAGLLLPLELRKGPVNVRLFTVISAIGTPIDVTLQELRMESFFPADAESEATLASLTPVGH